MIGQVTSCNKETCKPRKSDALKRFRQKGILFLLVTLLLFAVALPGGLAAEIDELPETWEELCASLPDLPDLEIENVRVRFPNKSDTDFTVSFFCDSEGWSNASGVAGFTYSFLYDAEKSAYVMDDMSQEKLRMAWMTGTVSGYFALAKTDGPWIVNLLFYVDREAFGSIYSADEPFTCTWDNVTDFTTSNYLMPNIVAQRDTENGNLQIWQYATHTIVLLRDEEGNETARMQYPEFSEFCADFTLVDPFE